MKKLLVFDSHPVQYRVPVWQAMEKAVPGSVHVVYASDCSVKGHADKGFGKTFAWDEPLLSGYDYTILHAENGEPLAGWNSLTGKGIEGVLKEIKPDIILLTGLLYRYDLSAFNAARSNKIPVWLRCETQDFASPPRSVIKTLSRSIVYKYFYSRITHFFYIGELNKLHYKTLGVPDSKLSPALYGTVDRYEAMSDEQKGVVRIKLRGEENITPMDYVIGFSGKFIFKKNPDILYKALEYLPDSIRKKTIFYFIGSGELEPELHIMATDAFHRYGVKSVFKGFINQSKIGDHYLAMDILVLPSRLMGETWGLVVNEALQAGCGVIVSEAVGSSKNFGGLQRFRTIAVEDARGLGKSMFELENYKRNFSWALKTLETYSIKSTAKSFLNELM